MIGESHVRSTSNLPNLESSVVVREWHEPRALPANTALLEWLKETAEPPKRDGMEFAGYELHTHPGLVDRLVECAEGLPLDPVAAFGVPCLSDRDGRIVAIARGTNQIYIRGLDADPAARPAGLPELWGAMDAFLPAEWQGMSLHERRRRQQADQRELLVRLRKLLEQAANAREVATNEPPVEGD